MPTYLLHGFRWPRPLIRIHIVMQNLDEAAPGWLVAPGTTLALLKNFKQLYPDCMQHLTRLRFVEQYDPNDPTGGVSQPFAYVADLVEEVKLGVEIDEVRGRGLNNEQWAAIMELRDNLAPEEKIGWYIVVCGDEERPVPTSADTEEAQASSSSAPNRQSDVPSGASENVASTKLQKKAPAVAEQSESKSGLKKFMSLRLGRRKSRTPVDDSGTAFRSKSSHSVNRATAESSSEPPPPLPTGAASSDGASSTPSLPQSASASTPPLPDDVFELPAITPRSSTSTPPPLDDNFFPEIEPKTRYARMFQIPDYRATWFPAVEPMPAVEPKAAYMPPIETLYSYSARRHSEQSLPLKRYSPDKRNSTRRRSDMSGIEERIPRTSDVSGRLRRSTSHNSRIGRRMMSFPNDTRSGAVSPLTFRSISPVGRDGAISPIGRSHSLIRSGAISPLTQDEQPFGKIQRRSTFQLRQQRRAQNLSLVTQALDTRPDDADSDEEMDEVIVMSPVVRAPTKHFVRRSGTIDSIISPVGKSAGTTNGLDSIVESDRPYFGQDVNAEDLVAVNLENAFDRL